MRGRIPDQHADWPNQSRIRLLLATAEAVESRTFVNRRLRQYLELPAHTPITESLLCERMRWEEYSELLAMYGAWLVQDVRRERMDADA